MWNAKSRFAVSISYDGNHYDTAHRWNVNPFHVNPFPIYSLPSCFGYTRHGLKSKVWKEK